MQVPYFAFSICDLTLELDNHHVNVKYGIVKLFCFELKLEIDDAASVRAS